MDNLLTSRFIAHYALAALEIVVPFADTNAERFELKDDAVMIYFNEGEGVARYHNNNRLLIKVVNYESFHHALPNPFQQGKSICDLIVYTKETNNYFSLNELTDTNPLYIADFTNASGPREGKRNKAMRQLNGTLQLLITVPEIATFINTFQEKRCCFFNKQSHPPITATVPLTVTTAFNRINTITEEGFEMGFPAIESLGFSLYEYSGGQAATVL